MTRLLALGCFLACAAHAQERGAWRKLPQEKIRPRVAVLYFEVSSAIAEHGILHKGLSEMLIADLANDRNLVVVERGRLEEVLAELKRQHSAAFDQSGAQQLGKLLGAHYLVLGTIWSGASQGKLAARVLEVETGALKGSRTAAIKNGDLFEAETALAQGLAELLAELDVHPAPEPKKKLGKLKLETAVQYSQALDAIDRKDHQGAKEKLAAVVKAQPDFLLATLELDRLMK